MFELMVEDTFNSAHFLKNYPGNCQYLHGHNFKVQLFVQGNVLNQIGLLADYKILKQELGVVLAELDHKLLNDLFEFNPTSELIAQHIFQKLKIQFTNQIKLAKVVVWESDKTCAAYFEE